MAELDIALLDLPDLGLGAGLQIKGKQSNERNENKRLTVMANIVQLIS